MNTIDKIQRTVVKETLEVRYGKDATFNQSCLRARTLLATGLTNIVNSLGESGTNDYWPKLLTKPDHFFATHMRIGLQIEDPAKPGTGEVRLFGINEAMDSVFNGFTKVEVSSATLINDFDTRRCRVVPQYVGITDNVNREYDENTYDDGFVELSRYLTFKGEQRNQVTTTFPALLAAFNTGLAPRNVYLVQEFSGILVSGGTELESRMVKK